MQVQQLVHALEHRFQRSKKLTKRVRMGLTLIGAAEGIDRAKIAGYLAWDFLNHTVKVPAKQFDMTLQLDGCRVTVRAFSSQLGAYVDIFHHGDYELVEGFRPQRGWTVIDAGANVGFFALRQANAVGPQGHVYSFEPNPEVLPTLRRNILQNDVPWVECIPKALAGAVGELKLEASSRETSCGRVVHEGSGTPIEATTLDAFVRERGIERIDLLKLDTEGAEVEIIEGAREVALPRTQRIVMESHRTRHKVREQLEPLGFEVLHDGYNPNVVYFARP